MLPKTPKVSAAVARGACHSQATTDAPPPPRSQNTPAVVAAASPPLTDTVANAMGVADMFAPLSPVRASM